MDQIKTGAFIQQLRREKGLTQRELAEKLLVSDKTVSKWECGNGLPDVATMLPLCELLGISVNELLTGERVPDADYKKYAEENIMDLMQEKEESKRRIILSVIAGVPAVIGALTLFIAAEFLEMTMAVRVILIVVGFVTMLGGIITAGALDRRAGTYECRKCGCRFVPTSGAYIMGIHGLTWRHLKCPQCGKRTLCRRHLTH